ncbi:hypothetical protein TWF970_011248 [Orbilia oligospora]|uniref:Uncharacterized protein n=1 Tax=Orbilia oligospora TaxID=2813651 RepID=A0A7C8VAA6_ORBOL|nr:hypothetical protein TWF970_011248 [Orbilia oligospora]
MSAAPYFHGRRQSCLAMQFEQFRQRTSADFGPMAASDQRLVTRDEEKHIVSWPRPDTDISGNVDSKQMAGGIQQLLIITLRPMCMFTCVALNRNEEKKDAEVIDAHVY